MGLFKMSSSSYDGKAHAGMYHPLYTGPSHNELVRRKTNGQPNPLKYEIINSFTQGNFLLIEVNYHDCTNYEGRKLLVYENVTLADLKKQGSLDPHFSNNPLFHSPIARFVPTKLGWDRAKAFCLLMKNLSL